MKALKMKRLFTAIMLAAFLTSMISIMPVKSITVGLVGDWKLDEGLGSVADDATTNNNDGILSGGKFGNALDFNGVDNYVIVPSSSDLFGMNQLTVEAWIFLRSNDFEVTLMKWVQGNVEDGASYALEIYQQRLYGLVKTNGQTYVEKWGAGAIVTINTWHHVALVWDGTVSPGVMNLYMDGVLQATISNVRLTGIIDNTPAIPIYIGGWSSLGTYFFNGKIDEVRISNSLRYTGLSYTIPASAFTLPDVNSLALWHFDESVGTIAYDATTNHNGTISDAKWAGPTWVAGQSGTSGDYALHFDGIDDYVRVPDNSILDVGVGTWEAYLKFNALPSEVGGLMNPLAKSNQYWIHASNGYQDNAALPVISRVDSIQAKITIGGQRYVVSTAAHFIEKNVWYHVVGTYDGSKLELFVDGISVDEYAVSGTIDAGGQMLALGTWSAPTVDYFKGVIDDVRLWNVGLASLKLEFDPSSTPVAPINSLANLKVLLTDANDNPVHGMEVDFTSLPSLTIPSGTTDALGYATTSVTVTTPNVYTITASVSTFAGTVSAEWTLAVYDPSAGFVTGGGWIDSPAGAYTADPLLEEKATFGFVSKYQKGANVPTGNTEFIFHVADFKFKSTSYQWLVVAGTKAQYKGEGTINGAGNYGFMLTAEDGGKTGTDTFRIKIWDIADDAVVYDNGAQTPISGGSIIVHK